MITTTTNSTLSAADEHRKKFYELAAAHIQSLNYKFREKAVITENMKKKIFRCFSNKYPQEFTSNFKTWCETSFIIGEIGSEQVLYHSENKKEVLIYENMYDTYKQVHEQTAHGGRDKCLDSLAINYSWFNRKLVQQYIDICYSCQNRQSVKIPTVSKPIIELGKIFNNLIILSLITKERKRAKR